MKKFKMIYWNDCRGMEIESIEVKEFNEGRKVLEYLIENKLGDEDWVNYVNGMFNYKGDECNWVNNREEWDMFLIGERGLEDKEFSIDFSNEFESCLVLREDSIYFDREFEGEEGCKLVNEVESIWGY
jgi:hypothetical protein